MNQTFCRAAHDRPARILPAAITHRKNAPPGVVGRRSGYALAPPGHPRQESHPDCRCRLTLIVAGHTDPLDDVGGSVACLDGGTERLPGLLQIWRLGV